MLRIADYSILQLQPRAISIHLRASKTDVFRKTVDVKIGNATALDALEYYLKFRRHSTAASEPLFAFDDGTPITRRRILTETHYRLTTAGIDLSKHSGLSFRRGGATSLSTAGVSDRLIKIIGRWNGWSYARYIETPIGQIITASASL